MYDGNVSLSGYYCLPNKLFEYCFCVPIASDFPDIVDVVSKFKLGYVRQDKKAYIKLLNYLLATRLLCTLILKLLMSLAGKHKD